MMKQMMMAVAMTLLMATGFAQEKDSTAGVVGDTTIPREGDTLRVGNFIIVKQPGSRGAIDTDSADRKGRRIVVLTSPHGKDSNYYRHSAFTTNWLIFDLGFANVNDQTDYNAANSSTYLRTATNEPAFSKSTLGLRTKTSNVNIWLVMQKLNIASNALNLKYGIGYEMFNFRYDENISYNKTPAYIYRDSIDFSKNKLFVGYVTAPLMVNINPWPHKKRFMFSVGASAGYRLGSHTKQVSEERGKEKTRGDFDLNKWRFAYVAEVGVGPVRVYGSYSINPLHAHTLTQYPYAVGIRFSSW